MTTISGLSSQPKQTFSFVLDDGSQVSCYIEYRPQQRGWFANFAWQDWAVYGLRLTAAPNILKQWQNLIPFGLALLTTGNVEPLNPTDFADLTARLIVLNAADVASVNEVTYSGN